MSGRRQAGGRRERLGGFVRTVGTWLVRTEGHPDIGVRRALSGQEPVVGLVPEQDLGSPVVQDQLAAIGPNRQYGVMPDPSGMILNRGDQKRADGPAGPGKQPTLQQNDILAIAAVERISPCLLYTSPSPRD